MRTVLAACAASLVVLSLAPLVRAGDDVCDPAKASCMADEQKIEQTKAVVPESKDYTDEGSGSTEPNRVDRSTQPGGLGSNDSNDISDDERRNGNGG